jgi:hypothetical protein
MNTLHRVWAQRQRRGTWLARAQRNPFRQLLPVASSNKRGLAKMTPPVAGHRLHRKKEECLRKIGYWEAVYLAPGCSVEEVFFEQLLSRQRGVASPDSHRGHQKQDEDRASNVPTGKISGDGNAAQ